MHFRAVVAVLGIVLLSSPTGVCQSPQPPQNSGVELPRNILGALIGGDVVQAAEDFRKGSEALDRFGRALEKINVRFADATIKVSENVAKTSAEFDPFGFKTAFETIQRQNEIVREQSETIKKLQQQEIRRLRIELKRSKRRK